MFVKCRIISTLITNAKLQILLSRDKHIKSVLADVNKELKKLRNDKIHYEKILKNLVLQSMYQVDTNFNMLSMN